MNIRASATFKPRDLAQIEAKIVPVLIAASHDAAEAAAGEARALVPVRTGKLRDSIGTRTEWVGHVVKGHIVATAEHAGFVEFGTGLAGSGTYPYNLPQQGVPKTGSWVYDYKNQNWPGMVARPYLRPPLDTARDQILQAYTSRGLAIV